MTDSAPWAKEDIARLAGAAALVVVALVLMVLCAPFIVQAFRGPRTITDEELLAMKSPGWWDNYVRFTPKAPAKNTEWVYGVKGNEGTKFLLLPVGDRYLFCSARVKNEGPEFIGSLGFTETAVETVVSQEDRAKLLPFMLQTVRSIWFDTAAALLVIAGCLGGAAWLALEGTPQGRKLKRDMLGRLD
jgi:hypothetical protein